MSSDGGEGRSSWFVFFPAWPWPHRHHQEEEEEEEGTTTFVPSSASSDDDDHGDEEGKEQDPTAEDRLRLITKANSTREPAAAGGGSSSSGIKVSSSAWWRAVLPPTTTRGVGSVIGGLVVLAVLLATTTTWWTHHLDYSSSSFLPGLGSNGQQQRRREGGQRRPAPDHHLVVPIPFSCHDNSTVTVVSMPPSMAPSSSSSPIDPPPPRCPDYFRHIHSDLAPWRETGITREAVESGRSRAAFRLTVVGGRAFVETYHRVFQTRDTFTQWGVSQLLARYPGRVPDLDLMFNCEDMPEVRAADFPVRSMAPPLFRYCKDDSTLDIVFPDWSFWGWPEVNIRPWAPLLEEMDNETRRLPWPDREPLAFWKGNPGVSRLRQDLLRCNGTHARVVPQDWGAAIRAGFKHSNLAKQCRYRYKVFVQGRSWSVSEKYILACDSPTLLVATPYKDFFSRGLVSGRHYWPIDPARMCPAIEFAVDWGNAHPAAARRMAAEGSGFARRDLAMDYVYDYMLHLLTEYAKLLRYKPTVPENAVELRPETLACPARGRQSREFDFMMQSRERHVAGYEPCTLPQPFTAHELQEMARKDQQVKAQVNKMMIKAQQQKKKKKHRL